MTENNLVGLLHKYFNDTATEEERDLLMSAILDDGKTEKILTVMEKVWVEYSNSQPVFTADKNESLIQKILAHRPPGNPAVPIARPVLHGRWRTSWWPYAAAAMIVAIVGVRIWFLAAAKRTPETTAIHSVKKNISPGGNKAILSLADGSLIVLDSAATGTLAAQGGTIVKKTANGEIVYTPDATTRLSPQVYNTLATPRSGQYSLRLPDGTRVWLNAASSFRYPAVFSGKERKVEITGEAYFEVAANPQSPFKVVVNGSTEVEVLGTDFNVNAYTDEPKTSITLIGGSVKVIGAERSAILLPRQQAQVLHSEHSAVSVKDSVDIEAVTDWKNGLFAFDRTDIRSAMRKISRWYDVDVTYEGDVKGFFSGTVSRKEDLGYVLKMLELTGEAHFQVDGRKVLVKP